MAGTTSAQYQHFVPQVLLRNYSHPYKPQNNGRKHTSTLQVTTRQNQTFGASYAPHNHDDICSDSKLNRKSDLTEGDNEHVGSRNRKYAERERHKGIVLQPSKELQAHVKRQNRRARRRTRQAAIASAGPEPARIKAYKAAGLGRRGLWSFSQRNRAKALAQIEPAPDINQIDLFDPQEMAITSGK